MWLNLHSVVSVDLIMPACLGYVLNNDQRSKYCVSAVPGEGVWREGGREGGGRGVRTFHFLYPPLTSNIFISILFLFHIFLFPSCKFQVFEIEQFLSVSFFFKWSLRSKI